MKSFAFYRKENQIFARFIAPNKQHANEIVFECEKEYGVIISSPDAFDTREFETYGKALKYVDDIIKRHPDYNTIYQDSTDWILKKKNEYITIKIVY